MPKAFHDVAELTLACGDGDFVSAVQATNLSERRPEGHASPQQHRGANLTGQNAAFEVAGTLLEVLTTSSLNHNSTVQPGAR